MKKILYLAVCVVFASILLVGCTDSEIKETSESAEKAAKEAEDQIRNITDSQDSHVLGVKNGHPLDNPDTTYGDAFEEFFTYPTWKYFVGRKEGPDEDGDGKPDYEEDNVDIVEFTGYCTYMDTEVKALIQFTLDKDEDTFDATYLSFNEVPQNMLTLYALLDTAFKGDETEQTDEENTADTEAEEQPVFSEDLSFPIMYLGYTEDFSPCPVMVNEDVSGMTKYGTYEEMTESLVDNGVTMYAPPAMEEKVIYTATKWDAPDSEWFNGLMTYGQFLDAITYMNDAYVDNGVENFYCGGSWDDVCALSGRWSSGGQEISISIYSDSDYYNAFDEIGTISVDGQEGSAYCFGRGDDAIYVLCSIDGGGEWMIRYYSNGKFDVWRTVDESPVKSGMEFECIESFMP